MPTIRLALLLILAANLAAGCATSSLRDLLLARTAGKSHLEEGIRNYEEGNYRTSARRLQYALEEGLTRPDRVMAHKYLAFIACVSGQQVTCREEFSIALELDPSFELDAAEAGHPIWGPVYKSVKEKQKG
jgi:Tfp pilus assembly protein PilF